MKSLLYWAFVLSLVAGLLVAGGVKSARAWHVGEPTDKLFDDMIEKAQREQEEAPHYWERQAEKEQEFQDRLQERRARDCYLSRCRDDDDYLGELQNRNSEDRDPVNELMDDLQQDDPWR